MFVDMSNNTQAARELAKVKKMNQITLILSPLDTVIPEAAICSIRKPKAESSNWGIRNISFSIHLAQNILACREDNYLVFCTS